MRIDGVFLSPSAFAAVLLALQGCASEPAATETSAATEPETNGPSTTTESETTGPSTTTEPEPTDTEPEDPTAGHECDPGATRCEGGQVSTCTEEDGAPQWGAYEDCPSDQICKQTACEAVTAKQLMQADAVEQYANDLRDYTGYFEPIDFTALTSDARRLLFLGDGSEYALARAIHHVFRGVPQGHAATGFGPEDYSACMDRAATVPLRGISWYGVCARAAGDSAIVTFAAMDNPMGLQPGDRVVKVTKNNEVWQSPGLLARIGEEPLCDGSLPSQSAREDYAATNLFALLDEGATIDVIEADGNMRTIDVPERAASFVSCFDPFRRPSKAELYASSQRPDGVVVLVLPTLGANADHPFPDPFTIESYRDWIAEGVELIKTELAQYDDITGLVWDLRGNGGGSQELGVALIDPALLGEEEGALANCFARIPASSPPAFETDSVEYPFPYQAFVDDPLPALGYTGKQAVVVDGTAYSAADWMVYAAKKKGVPIVGHASAGAYGYSTGGSYVNKNIAPVEGVHGGILSAISGAKCVDTATGEAMEGTAPIDVVVDFKPEDLAIGVDTQLEAAVAIVLEP